MVLVQKGQGQWSMYVNIKHPKAHRISGKFPVRMGHEISRVYTGPYLQWTTVDLGYLMPLSNKSVRKQ